MLSIVLIILGALALIVVLAWAGLQVTPAPFPASAEAQPPLATVPLPKGLPAPVERFLRVTYGENIPVIKTAVITGRGTIRPIPFLPKWPIRYRFTHVAGQDYRHYFEITWFGLTFARANEYYVGGKERMVMPWGVSENNPKLDQGGALGMWAESFMWLPAILATDPEVRWQAIDDDTAWLIVPFGGQPQRVLMRFDPATGKMLYWEMMRYKNGEGDKTLWINGTWFEDGRPWAQFDAEETRYNVPVDVSMSAAGL